MHTSTQRILRLGLVALCAMSFSVVGLATETDSVLYTAPESTTINTVKNGAWNSQEHATIKLTTADVAKAKAAGPKDKIERQIGFARSIDSLDSLSKANDALKWQTLSDGSHTATLLLSSPEAKAIRQGIYIGALPEETELRFFSPQYDEADVITMTGQKILTLVAKNLQAGVNEDTARLYWSPSIPGDTIGIEIYLPVNVSTSSVKLAFPKLSHFYTSIFAETMDDDDPPSSYCTHDATCYTNMLYYAAKRATAKMVFADGDFSYLCSGTLINDIDRSTSIPYFATANHCINGESVASTLETHWFYDSLTCDSNVLNGGHKYISGGAEVLYTRGRPNDGDGNQDFTLLQLLDRVPNGVVFMGWTTDRDEHAEYFSISHPKGSLKKIAFASYQDMNECYEFSGSDSFWCEENEDGNFLKVYWEKGGVEGGSSGSGLFNDAGKMVGVLYGGWSPYCRGGDSYYSEFQAAYKYGNLGQWLNTILSNDDDDDAPPPVTLTSLTISAASSMVDADSSIDLTCTATYSDGSTADVTTMVTWSDDSSYASIGTGGHLYAQWVTIDQTVTVTATLSGITDTYTLTINGATVTSPWLHLLL